MILALTMVSLLCALVPAILFTLNLRLYLDPPSIDGILLPAVSILIPARNEAVAIADAVRSALSSQGVEFEVVVMDDGSTDGTDEIVRSMAREDSRVRLAQATQLPAGWNGKQYACWSLAHVARNPVLCFVDADVRLGPECVGRMAGLLERGDNGLVSGFPQQITGTFLEWMLLPLIHFVLLGFLPIGRMRAGTDPSFAAGCGQFIMSRRDAYFACGGHSGIKLTMHDGLRLPRRFREHGFRTDLADITSYARCRMYTNAADTWSGLAKNATEGIAAPSRIVPITLLLLFGQIWPFVIASVIVLSMLCAGTTGRFYVSGTTQSGLWFVAVAVPLVSAWLPRWLGVKRFKQDWRSALLHPFGILLLIAVQWYALFRKFRGGAVSWRGRAYTGN